MKKLAHKRILSRKVYLYPYLQLKRFCRAILAFCNAVLNRDEHEMFERPWKSRGFVISNEGTAPKFYTLAFEESPAISNEGDGWYKISPFGDFEKGKIIQRIDAAVADSIIGNAQPLLDAAKENSENPLPVYLGHPDDPAYSKKYSDKNPYGKTVGLERRKDGLWAKIAWEPRFAALASGYRFSPRWTATKDSKGVYSPFEIVSLGLTRLPNISGTSFANEDELQTTTPKKEISMSNKIITAVLALLGYSPEQITATIEEAEGAPAESEILEKIGKLKLADRLEVKGELLESVANEEFELVKTQLKQERTARATEVISNCVIEGRLSKADEAAAITVLSNASDFDAVAKLYKEKPVVYANASRTDGLGKRESTEVISNASAAQIQARAAEIVANEGISFGAAWNRAEAELNSTK